MRNKQKYYILTLMTVIFIGCGTDNKNEHVSNKAIKTTIKIDSLHSKNVEIKETFNQEDIPVNTYLTERLKSIRSNFKRINSIANWTIVKTKDNWETTEGGNATYYYLNGQLEKITTRHFGETFQQLTEYYLLKGQLSFVFTKSYKYNRPMYYDSMHMKENNDTEAFDFKKSVIVENRSYFENGKLLHQLKNQDSGLPVADSYLMAEQKRIEMDFQILIKLGKTK